MSIFNEKQIKGMSSREYVCSKCGKLMEFEDEWEETLVCPSCGHDVALENYGCENEESYANLYPNMENTLDISEDDDHNYGETYDEVCGELDD